MKNQKYKYGILIGIVIIILGYLYYSFYFKNEVDNISKAKMNVEIKTVKLAQIQSKENTIDDEIKTIVKKSKSLDVKIPDQYDKKPIILYFYNLIKRVGVKSDFLTLSEGSQTGKSYKTISANLNISGTYDQVWDFIELVENAKRKYNIKQCSFNQNTEGFWTASMLIEFYSIR